MKKTRKIIVAISAAAILGGTVYMVIENESFKQFFQTKMDLRSEKEKQLDFLKENQEEIIDFVKSQNPKIESVQIDWDKTQWDQVGNGTPWGAGEIIDIYGRINNIDRSGWHVMIDVPEGEFKIDSMTLANYITIGGKPID